MNINIIEYYRIHIILYKLKFNIDEDINSKEEQEIGINEVIKTIKQIITIITKIQIINFLL